MSRSELSIGPIEFTHEVQEISIQEVKAVDTLQATRTSKNFISETGQGSHRAVIRLLITGIDEINGNLRKLVALFKCCPIISVYNELLSKSWNPDLSPIKLNDQQVDTREGPWKRLLYVPVALEDLAISSVPDLPFSFYVTLSVSRVDVSSVYGDNILLYSDKDGNPTVYPERAFYLKKWIDILLKTQKIPLLYASDFEEVSLEWNGEYITGETIPPPSADTDLRTLRFNRSSHAKIQSEQCSIKNLFAYNVLQGKGYPFPQHMGSTSMYYSMDILFTDQTEDDKEYNIFCSFKESSDYIARAKERLTRVAGWELSSPVVKMLSAFPTSTGRGNFRPRSAVFVPLNVTIDTANLPPLNKAVRVDLAETNFEVFSNSETLLVQGGSDYSGLKAYFDSIVKNDYEFRSTIRSDSQKLAKSITGQDTSINATKLFDDHATFWPIINGYFRFSTNETFGLLNKDTLLAVFLDTKFDEQEKLRIALQANITIAGRVATGIKLPNIFYRTDINYEELRNSFFGADPESQSFKKVFEIIYDYVQNKMFYGTFSVELEKFYGLIASKIFTAFFGGYEGPLTFTNSGGEAVQLLSQSGYPFNKPFTDALFNVIAKRSGPPQEISRAYSVDGLMAAYLKLAIKYTGDSSSSPDLDNDPNKDVSTAINKFFRRSVYEDLILPKYVELYDSRWKEFAPTYSDVGIINSMPGKSTLTSNDAQNYIVVEENDTVSPSAWFYNKKYKQDLFAQVTDNAKDVTGLGNKFHLSIPFSTEDLDNMEKELAKEKELQANNPSFRSETLAQTIRIGLAKAKINSLDDYNKGINQLSIAAAERYYDQYMGDGRAVFSLYVHHNDNIQTRKRLSAPGLAKAVLTVAQDFKLLRPSARLPQPVTDAGYKSADRANEFEWIRSLDTNTKNTIESDINQIPDIYESSAKMFPAMKVYLLEKRGTDLYGDDSFFSVNPIISIDITMDKDDADLAVIRIADPLFILQRAFFPSSNVITVDGENGSTDIKQILGSLKGNNLGGYLKRYKIIEGRPIQIRMGYEAMPFNLKTVFTGRIVEIQPGDVLTIVCQSWKAELINKQVTFYNDNTQNWGVRDLVIQAIQNSNPDGYGDFFPQLTSDFILKNLQGIDIQEFLSTVLQRQEGVDTESGSRSVGGQITNYVYETLSLQSRAENNKGIDTRLKNVWWPDLPSPNNFLGWRQFSGILPSQANDGWIIPLQTTWDVLKEGSRHSWNSIVQVVPFDGEATLFFGHPDQPYYFTKGGPNSRQKWKKYIGSKTKFVQDSVRLVKGFLTSKDYTNNIPKAFSIKTLTGSIDALFLTPQSKLGTRTSRLSPGDISSFIPTDIELFGDTDSVFNKLQFLDTQLVDQVSNFVDITGSGRARSKFPAGYKGLEYILDKSNVLQEVINRSYLPERALESIRGRLGNRTVPILLKLFWDVQEDQLYRFWPSVETDVVFLIKSQNDAGSNQVDTIVNKLFGSSSIPTLDFFKGLRTTIAPHFNELLVATNNLYNPGGQTLNIGFLQPRFGGAGQKKDTSVFPLFKPKIDHRTISSIANEYFRTRTSSLKDATIKQYRNLEDKIKKLEVYIGSFTPFIARDGILEGFYITKEEEVPNIRKIIDDIIDDIITAEALPKSTSVSGLEGISSPDDIKNNLANFKAFVYFFDQYLKNNPETEQITKDLTSGDLSLVPPNMQVFRQHHWIDTDHDIINNHIVASTKDMWNTVVVEYPAHAEASAKLNDLEVKSGDIYNQGEFYSGLKWVYYPSNEVSGVVGLQFHPGLTLANKKIKIFTELNCQSEELACKLACTHLADGIRRMYRGTLAVTGRIIKPHDRIILNDEYLEMTGPLEVESVVHHWSIETGWVSNIAPQAVCDANPGAAVLQTAALEDAFNKVFKLLDYASEALVIASILATVVTAGGAAPAAIGAFSLRSTLLTGLKGLLNKGRTKFVADVVKGNVASVVQAGRFTIKAKGSPKLIIRKLWKDYGGLGKSVFGNYLSLEATKQISHSAFRIVVTSSFVENAQKVEQLPVILSPLIFNGLPFLAGMETDDPVWSVHFNDVFWSLRDFNRAGEQFLQSLGVESYADLQSELKKI